MIQPLCLVVLMSAAGDAPDAVQAEADRLAERARARGAQPGGAVDLIRVEELAEWLPEGAAAGLLREAAVDPTRAPLVRAVGWWLLRGLALERLEMDIVAEANAALGLLDRWAVRAGAAPSAEASLDPGEWRRFPPEVGAGELWLESILRPARETRAAVATRVVAKGGPAVLRIGYDDAVTVWLNGEEIYVSPAAHAAWLDQAAVPVVLRAGDNRLVIEVRQRSGAWRLVARFTDDRGEPLPVEARADPWGAPPDPAVEDDPDRAPPAHLWSALMAGADHEPPRPAALRDLADYARRTGLPDDDQAIPRVAIEGAWAVDPTPRNLRAWLRVLPSGERAGVQAAHPLVGPFAPEERFAELALRTQAGWRHYYARRHRQTRRALESVLRDAPDFLPAYRLAAVLFEDLDLPQHAALRLEAARRRWPGRVALRRAHAAALQSVERTSALVRALDALVEDGQASADDRYRLAGLLAPRGDAVEAVALLDEVYRARPELWQYAFEAAQILLAAGRRSEARERLEALAEHAPGEATVSEALARLALEAGEVERAAALVDEALRVDPGAEPLRALSERIRGRAAPRLGPSTDALRETSSPAGPVAHVLYHHARTEVGEGGLARRRLRRVVRILTEEGARRYARWELPYVPGRQVLELETARLLREGQPPASPARSDRDLSEPAFRLYYDLRAEVLDFGRPRSGDLIEVAWTLRDVDPDPAFPGYYGELAYLQESIPRARSVVEVAGPVADALQVELVARGLPVKVNGGRFELRDAPAVRYEPKSPGRSSVYAYVHVSSASGWDEIDRRYLELLDARDAPTQQLAVRARQWIGEAETPAAIVERLYTEVAHRTRYVGLEFGVHGFKPEHPAVTFARGYGDCKDTATLLIALARAVGVEAHLTLVRTRPSGDVQPSPASFAIFDHAIVYVPALERFFDPTVDRNDPWTLPPSDQGARAFVVGLDSTLRRVPAQPAERNQSAWRLELAVADGVLRGNGRWTTRGHPATVARRALEGEGARREVAERALGRRFPGARLRAPAYGGLAPARDPVTVDATVELPMAAGAFELPLGGAPWNLVSRYAQSAERDTPLQIDYRSRRRLEMSLDLGGRAATLPPPVELESPFGRFRATARRADGRVETEVELELSVIEVTPDDYSAFRRWLGQVDQALAARVEVRR